MSTRDNVIAKLNELTERAWEKGVETSVTINPFVRGELGYGSTSPHHDEDLLADLRALIPQVQQAAAPLSDRDATRFDPVVSGLDNALTRAADPVTESIDTAKSDLADWRGNAAEAFEQNFLQPFPKINENHLAALRELRGAAAANRKVVETGQQDLISICDKGITAVDGVSGELKDDITVALTVIGAVAAVAATVATAGTGTPAIVAGLAAVTAGAASTTAAVVSSIGGDTVPDVLRSVLTAIGVLNGAVDREEGLIATAMDQDAQTVLGRPELFRLEQPDLPDGTGKGFRLPARFGDPAPSMTSTERTAPRDTD